MKRLSRISAILLVFSVLLAVPASAVSRASDQIYDYEIKVLPKSNGQVAIDFSVSGTGRMVRLGAAEITIDEQLGGSWAMIEYMDQDDSGMTVTDESYYGNTIYFDGEPGTKYRVTVTIFAEDEERPDYRTETFYITARD